MIEIENEVEVKDEEFNPTYEDEETEEEETQEVEDEETEETEEEKPIAPIVEMNQPKTEDTDNKPKTISQMFGGIATFIEVGLKEMAKDDEELMALLNNENKSLDECIKYVIGEFQQKVFRGNGMSVSVSDDENGADILELALHYYETPDCHPRGMFAPSAPPKPKKEPKPKEEKKPKEKKQKSEPKPKQPTMTKEEIDALSKPMQTAEQPKVFSGYKKGSKAYNKALNDSLQGDLFGGMFNEEDK